MRQQTNILLIEDDSVLAELYREAFERAGMAVDHALDGERGLALIQARPPALVLLDIMLPKQSGLSVLEKLKQTPETAEIPVVLLTNVGDQECLDRGQALGATEIWIKSDVTPPEVVTKVRAILKTGK